MVKKSGKKAVWLYAVVLFSSAFIVLLLTAYSQIKFNKNISEYRKQISDDEKTKIDFQTNLKSLNEENKNLKKSNDTLKKDIKKTEEKITEVSKKLEENQIKFSNSLEAYEMLLNAENYFAQGDLVKCVDFLRKNIKYEFLSDIGKEKYNEIKRKSFNKVSLLKFQEGFKFYKNGLYNEAIASLIYSVDLLDTEYYSDDCYFFLAYSEYRIGNREKTKEYINILLNKYPDTSYKYDAIELKNKL